MSFPRLPLLFDFILERSQIVQFKSCLSSSCLYIVDLECIEKRGEEINKMHVSSLGKISQVLNKYIAHCKKLIFGKKFDMVIAYILGILVALVFIYALLPVVIFVFTLFKLIKYIKYKYSDLPINTDEKVKLFSISFVALIFSNLFLSNFDLSWGPVYPDPVPSWLVSFLISANISTIIGILILQKWSRKIELREKLFDLIRTLRSEAEKSTIEGVEFFKTRNYQSAIDKWNHAKSNLNNVLNFKDKNDIDVENIINELDTKIYETDQLIKEKEKIIHLIKITETIIKNTIRNATNANNSLWLSALKILYIEIQNISQEFEDGKISYADAKTFISDLKEQAETLSTPPPDEKTGEASQEETLRRTFYDILGIKDDANREQIKEIYRKLSLIYHPDPGKGLGVNGDQRFREIKDAYETLIDEKKRKEYDIKIGV